MVYRVGGDGRFRRGGGGGWFVLCIELFEAIYIHLDILKLRVEGNDISRKLC